MEKARGRERGALQPQALFTAECSHTFHFHCITSSVHHGHRHCPLCKAPWTELPAFLAPSSAAATPSSSSSRRPLFERRSRRLPFYQSPEPRVFDDDEDPASPPSEGRAAANETVEVEIIPEFRRRLPEPPAAGAEFAILIKIKAPKASSAEAPTASDRAPVDLVTVLDVSGSMAGRKIELVRRAMGFVVESLGPSDRLSVVTFSSGSRRLFRLRPMSDAGLERAVRAVDSLSAGGGTNIAEGLRKGAMVIDGRRHKNPVCGIMLLSDGQDNFTAFGRREGGGGGGGGGEGGPNYDRLIPASILHQEAVAIHTFGFGDDHDAAAMHRIAEATGGTFSYVEDEGAVQDAFAQCIGGLLSVAAQGVRVRLRCARPGLRITAVAPGAYRSRIAEHGRSAAIDAGDLYAEEERKFLAFVSVAPGLAAGAGMGSGRMMGVRCEYREAATGEGVEVEGEEVGEGREGEVERERARVRVAEAMEMAREAAEKGEMEEAAGILERRRRGEMERSEWVGDRGEGAGRVWEEMVEEMREMEERMASRQQYEGSGRAYVLSALSSHSRQRATGMQAKKMDSPGGGGGGGSSRSGGGGIGMSPSASMQAAYQTPAMATMVRRSQVLRGLRRDGIS